MKIILILLSSLIVFTYCKKDEASCKTYKKIEGQGHLIDINTIDVPEFKSIIDQNPQLQVYRYTTNNYTCTMRCHVFYEGLPVFTDYYTVTKNKASGSIASYDTLRQINLASLDPLITFSDAIKKAKGRENFDHTCISYRLGIYNIHAGVSYAPVNYKLVWKVQGEKEYPYVILDAFTNQVYVSDDGIVVN